MNPIQMFLSIKGRLGRRKYFIYCLALLSLALLIGSWSNKQAFTWAIFVLYILFVIQTIKRFHDINLSGWWTLLVLVPIVNLAVGAWALFKKGTNGKNKYDLN